MDQSILPPINIGGNPHSAEGKMAHMTKQISIALVEDDSHTRQRIAKLLAECLPTSTVTLFERLTPAIAFAKAAHQDYWLIDLGLPDGSGVDLIRSVRDADATAHILVISVFGDVDNVTRSIQAGANGYLLKDAVDKDLIDALAAMEQGGTPLSPMIASKLLETMMPARPSAVRSAAVPSAASLLSPKESELLNLLSRGYTYSESAELMQVALSTIQTHVRGIYAKLAVGSRAEAVFEAKAMGLIK
jgi:DNA-binding NarL/FixJ family response regulator